jgi:hypothetical protein
MAVAMLTAATFSAVTILVVAVILLLSFFPFFFFLGELTNHLSMLLQFISAYKRRAGFSMDKELIQRFR